MRGVDRICHIRDQPSNHSTHLLCYTFELSNHVVLGQGDVIRKAALAVDHQIAGGFIFATLRKGASSCPYLFLCGRAYYRQSGSYFPPNQAYATQNLHWYLINLPS